MKIHALPKKDKLTHFNVQYFQNEGGKGSARHVIQVTYSTNPDKHLAKNVAFYQKKVKFVLRVENKEINRTVKEHMGADVAAEIKAAIKTMKKEQGITTYMGFRKVEHNMPHKFNKNLRYFKTELDVNNYVMFYCDGENVDLRFVWEGDVIDTRLMEHVNPKPGQSMAYSFFENGPTDAELTEQIERLKNDKQADTRNFDGQGFEDGTSNYATTGLSSEVTDGTTARAESGDESCLQSQGSRRSETVCGQDSGSDSLATTGAVACSTGNGKAGELRTDYQAPAVKPQDKRRNGSAKRVRRAEDSDANQFAGTPFDPSWMVDREFETPFAMRLDHVDTDLGTSIRF